MIPIPPIITILDVGYYFFFLAVAPGFKLTAVFLSEFYYQKNGVL
jgi:hypothetical protein